MMNRREFLTSGARVAGLAAAFATVPAAAKLVMPDSEVVQYHGYDAHKDTTFLRISRIMPDGREWHNLVEAKGARSAGFMLETAEKVYRRALCQM